MDSDGDVEDERLAAVLGQSNLDQVIEAQPAASASSTLLRYSGGNAKGKVLRAGFSVIRGSLTLVHAIGSSCASHLLNLFSLPV